MRYTDPEGKQHPGTLSPATNTMTAQIDGKVYQGHFTVDLWGQSRAILTAADKEKLYCKFAYRVRDVSGTCTTPMGRSYDFANRQ